MNTDKTKSSDKVACIKSDKEATDTLVWAAVHEGIVDPTKQLIKCDFRDAGEPWNKRREFGKALRAKTPRESHADWQPAADRSDPVDIVIATNEGRQAHLIPLRMSRMAASPFTFLRGSVAIMARDLAGTPFTGVNVVMNGDAHINNFGLYGTPQRDVVLYLNDFDEVTIGPWEWDLKRLITSINVLGRENGLNRRERRLAVSGCVAGYRQKMATLQDMGVLDLWYLHNVVDRLDPKLVKVDSKSGAIIKKAVEKARKQHNASLLGKVAERAVNGAWRFKVDAPELTSVDEETKEKIIDALNVYSTTVAPERRFMLHRYHVADVAHRVVGVGSVGTRAYLVLLFGNGDHDPIFLQVKEALPPAHAPYLPALPETFAHDGLRVILGQRVLQASGDPLLGWTTIDDRPFYVRQMKNMKGSIPMEWLSGTPFNFFSRGAGILLARAHARTGDAAVIAGYCGSSDVLDEALADWAEAYGDQTVNDHKALLKAIESGWVIAR
ncbi:DUF2252 domain-containing protein [Methylobacter sp. S3L5C]|uniref:DUF2252 domain-containing protein n=1 Tax=Methylobacter sp. S3L5C TaxID=2839024 RepID=UPI001FADA36D|nr:DUF2252 domain-containing protein [Methylobacter sp. S3L5C]UOA08642.1 DUF2252 domain-containing protein [Methylobacter sp. S3L5C]